MIPIGHPMYNHRVSHGKEEKKKRKKKEMCMQDAL
jgi:hypothetical protein